MTELTESELVGLLYDAALGRTTWSKVVEALGQLLDCSSVYIGDPQHVSSDIAAAYRIPARFLELYRTEFYKHDPWAAGAARLGVYNKAQRGSDLVDDLVFERSSFYNDFLRDQNDAYHLAGALVGRPHGRSLIVGCHRPRALEAFSDEALAQLDRLLPHISRAAELHQSLLITHDTLDQMPLGTIQLNHEARLLQANEAAQHILKSEDGLEIANSHIRAAGRNDDQALQRLIAGAIEISYGYAARDGGGGFIRISRKSGKIPYSVLVSPVGLDRIVLSSSSPAALLFVSDPAAEGVVRPNDLRELFDLSPAEAQLVVGLTEGKSLRDIADLNGVSISTVRTLLQRAAAKTETNSQRDLLRLVLGSPRKWTGRG
jgi:DNA-binding CsgD family transcriptional regulator/PAS domain-containing protein